MNERLKQLRKECGLSQVEFGKRIGIGKTAVSKLEIGENKPSEQTIMLICKEFRVNYYWLKDGVGDMFVGTPQTVIDEIAEDYDLDNTDKKIIEKYLELSPDKRSVLKEYFKSVFINEETGN